MSMKRKRRVSEESSMSFLDVVCCGFGAIVLLLMITKTVEPSVLEETEIQLDGIVADLQEKLFSIRGETQVLNRELNAKHEQLDAENKRIAILRGQLDNLNRQYAALNQSSNVDNTIKGELELALQSLTEEMQRLLGSNYQSKNNLVGGIPVDSEYIIFIIDTSGSMFNYGWSRMMTEMVNILDIYPNVKGIQVMNDMGDYMFDSFRGKWIPDTPARRDIILQRLRSWNPFSNSSPVEGIERAIRTYYDPDKKISLYVLGDEFTGNSIKQVVDTVDRLNRKGADGERLVRIHAVGFPVQFTRPKNQQTTGIRFAALMRELTRKNGGTFVGLNDHRN
ncbi:VWA domain-containing protein [Sessilibacter sp. MAH2]